MKNYWLDHKNKLLLPDFDILTKCLKYSNNDAEEIVKRMVKQKLEDLKLQILAQNPCIIGVRA
jgi:hypothetical protein